MGSILLFNQVIKSYDGQTVLHDISIKINDGELFTFLGPSGCGKTTLLRILAGFEKPDSGTIEINGEDITRVTPEKRHISMVFQHYALFPHMTVFENVSYGLRVRGVAEKNIRAKVAQCLDMVRLDGFAQRDINELSGGEQQRVAIARAIAVDPGVLLLDEPLSNLDARLRETTKMEIRELQKSLGITTIFVTHDQQEAMTISDRIAVFHSGRIVRTGSPQDIYNQPQSDFVAGFIGESNIIEKKNFNRFGLTSVEAEMVCIRPQDIRIMEETQVGDLGGRFTGRIIRIEFRGSAIMYHVLVETIMIKVMVFNTGSYRSILPGTAVLMIVPTHAVKMITSSNIAREN
ncbi:MAG: ABC transporter ATP-binding protein [Desulfobacteraceae bacterium]|nr:ABC transporter ATP-binding protein [Desulfobacteraceae bacterium]